MTRTALIAVPSASPMNSPHDLKVLNPDPVTTASRSGDSLVLTAELEAEIKAESARLETATPQDILRWATTRFGDKLTMATAFGP